jgi:hypothetical protein
MTWPTQTIDTQHLDSGSDSPVLARPAIYQTAVNANLIQNSITTTGATDTSLLSYNSSTERFEPSASTTSLGYLVKIAVIEGGNIVSDPYGFVTDNGATWTVGSGTYLVHTYTTYNTGFMGSAPDNMSTGSFPSVAVVSGGTYNSTNARIFKLV